MNRNSLVRAQKVARYSNLPVVQLILGIAMLAGLLSDTVGVGLALIVGWTVVAVAAIILVRMEHKRRKTLWSWVKMALTVVSAFLLLDDWTVILTQDNYIGFVTSFLALAWNLHDIVQEVRADFRSIRQ